jgi:glycerol-3-phosphate dehydrogenase
MLVNRQLASHVPFDVAVVGGGINGVGIARDLAGRGLRVLLCERDDLGAHTSAASTKLVHGGLRYLEHFEFALVRAALAERERLLRAAPHLVQPQRFVLPHPPQHGRPRWLVAAGLRLYDALARGSSLPHSVALTLHDDALAPHYRDAHAYYDARTDDARLVVSCAIDAAERGAVVLPHTACVAAARGRAQWRLTLRDAQREWRVDARVLVNACGPWAGRFAREVLGREQAAPLRLVRGSHLVVPRRQRGDDAYLLQAGDGRVLFAIPFEDDFTLLGTTEVDVGDDALDHGCSDAEVDYLCRELGRHLRDAPRPTDVVWRYAGVRPLHASRRGRAGAASRDFALELDVDGAPLLEVWGGKLTTFRLLAERAADRVCAALRVDAPRWTAAARLPGGDLERWIGPCAHADLALARFTAALQQRWRWLPPELARRYARAYGTRVERVLRDARLRPARSLADLGAEVRPGLYAAEVAYLRREEWARTAQDLLWRRSKLGLRGG